MSGNSNCFMKNLRRNLFLGFLALCLTSCGTIPGKGQKAEDGYRAAAPIIAALEKFRDERGHYPDHLAELAPIYLPDSGALLIHGRVEPVTSPHSDAAVSRTGPSSPDSFLYDSKNDAYVLAFQYAGFGMNTCSYDSATKKWSASGYY
jgi:hypothetical protein